MTAKRPLFAMALATLLGCSAGIKNPTGGGGQGNVSSPGVAGSTGLGGHISNGGTFGGIAGTFGSLPDGAITDDGGDGGPICSTTTETAQSVPLDLYVLMDSSKSMLETTTAGSTKWKAVSDAMAAFFNDAGSASLGVAVKYFPDVQSSAKATCSLDSECGTYGPCDFRKTCVATASMTTAVSPLCVDASTCGTQTCSRIKECNAATGSYCAAGPTAATTACQGCSEFAGYCHLRDICTGTKYATPDIPITALPSAAIGPMLAAHTPDGYTPTGPALTGALSFARQRLASTPGHRVAVVLVTDGLPGGFLPGFPPSECAPSDIAGIAAIAGGAQGATGAPPVLTFVIGVFAPGAAATTAQTNLNMLAKAGGTDTAVIIDTGQNVTGLLQSALMKVQSKAIACEYNIPGTGVDFGKVNVSFTGSGTTKSVGHVPNNDPAGCPATGGWYYDKDPSQGTPTSIKACPASCTLFQTDVNGQVNIALGCPTIDVG